MRERILFLVRFVQRARVNAVRDQTDYCAKDAFKVLSSMFRSVSVRFRRLVVFPYGPVLKII